MRKTGVDKAQAAIKIARISVLIISHMHMQMTPPLWQKANNN